MLQCKKQNNEKRKKDEMKRKKNKAVYTAASVACFWAGAATLLIATSAKTAFSYQFTLFSY